VARGHRQCRTALALPAWTHRCASELRLTLAKNHAFAGRADEAEASSPGARELEDSPDAATSAELARAESYAAFHRDEWDHAFARHADVVARALAGRPQPRTQLGGDAVGPGRAPGPLPEYVDAELGRGARRHGRVGSLLL
jgi:hypothetical protein